MNSNHNRTSFLPSRRSWLAQSGSGLGWIALASLFQQEGRSSAADTAHAQLRPRARRVIQVFLEGGLSHIDSFDPKPELLLRNGQTIPGPDEFQSNNGVEAEKNPEWERARGIAFGSPFRFEKRGESGLEISELFPHLAKHADKLCVIRSMYGDDPAHQQAVLLMNTGDTRLIRPAVGSWITYGLGTENENLPGFVVLYRENQPIKGAENWQSAFLPGTYQGTSIDTQHESVDQLIPNIVSPVTSMHEQNHQLRVLTQINRLHQQSGRQEDDRLEARIRSFELAYRMQSQAGNLFDLSQEPGWVHELYGEGDAARQCILARRMAEAGVRYTQVYLGGWDHHSELRDGLSESARSIDQALAGLLQDLAQRGMLEDTLVHCTTEFGRTPTADTNAGSTGKDAGRDHNHRAFSVWMAGGGFKGGFTYGVTDELGWSAVENRVHVHDLHATLLYALGIDHERLTYRYAGRDFRLTDVHGTVVHDIFS
ncbi:MAG: DUF1501 domain-containing protein [Pirellula sp.]|nr:DUF1501 domain-containing protein [Pirellula sp.]